jgi:hypothetical protein
MNFAKEFWKASDAQRAWATLNQSVLSWFDNR